MSPEACSCAEIERMAAASRPSRPLSATQSRSCWRSQKFTKQWIRLNLDTGKTHSRRASRTTFQHQSSIQNHKSRVDTRCWSCQDQRSERATINGTSRWEVAWTPQDICLSVEGRGLHKESRKKIQGLATMCEEPDVYNLFLEMAVTETGVEVTDQNKIWKPSAVDGSSVVAMVRVTAMMVASLLSFFHNAKTYSQLHALPPFFADRCFGETQSISEAEFQVFVVAG